jgi:hypothetical protein
VNEPLPASMPATLPARQRLLGQHHFLDTGVFQQLGGRGAVAAPEDQRPAWIGMGQRGDVHQWLVTQEGITLAGHAASVESVQAAESGRVPHLPVLKGAVPAGQQLAAATQLAAGAEYLDEKISVLHVVNNSAPSRETRLSLRAKLTKGQWFGSDDAVDP